MAKRQMAKASGASLNLLLARAVDELHTKRTARLALQKQVDDMEAAEKDIKANVEGLLRELKLDGAHGEKAQVYFTRLQVPQLTDEEAFFAWGRLKANRDVMKVGVNNEAWRLRIADGVTVPGTESFLKETLQVKGVK